MRTFVAGLAFVLPYSLVYQMTKDRMGKKAAGAVGWKKAVPQISGILAGLSVSIAGNMHYVYYGQIRPWLQKLTGQEPDSYWFPDATRYIGFNPDVEDKTIHEFPCYSFVLGDLHAHVVNIMFVLLLLGLLYAWMKMVRKRTYDIGEPGTKEFWEKHLLMPQYPFCSSTSGNVPLDKLLGFCNLFCGNRRSCPVYQYCSDERAGKMGHRCNCSAGGRGIGHRDNCNPAVYPEF